MAKGRVLVCLRAALVTAAAVTVLLFPSSANSGLQKYWDLYFPYCTSGCLYGATSGSNYWQANRVWRPTGFLYWLVFQNSAGPHGAQSNRTDNPFTIVGSWGYDKGQCIYDSSNSGTANPTTCQIYTYVP
jgi:hypothetical protein